MGAHVAQNNLVPRVSLETRFNIACVGAFGYELDITKCSESELEIIKSQVEFYKAHRALLQYGNYYKLGNGIKENLVGGYMLVSDDKTEAMAVIFDKNAFKHNNYSHFKLKGLNDDFLYEVSMRKQSNVILDLNFTAYGALSGN